MSRERIKPYVEDSTKGHSLINPLNYKGDVLVQVWVDSRVMATLCRWLDNNGLYSRYMSQVVRRPLEVLTESMVENGEVEIVDDTAEARVILERRFGVDLSRGGRGSKNTMHNVALSVRRGELGERVMASKKFDDVSRPGVFKRRFSLEEIEAAANKPETLKRAAELREDREGKRGPDNSPIFGSSKVMEDAQVSEEKDKLPPLKEGLSQSEYEERMQRLKEEEDEEKRAMDEFLAGLKK